MGGYGPDGKLFTLKRELVDPLHPAGGPVFLQMDNTVECGGRVKSNSAGVQPGKRPKSSQSHRYGTRRVGVQAGTCTGVPGVHGGEQVRDFCPAALPHNKTVWGHAQRLNNQLPQVDFSGSFSVCGAGHHSHHVRVGGC